MRLSKKKLWEKIQWIFTTCENLLKKMDLNFKNKVVIVTGAGKGIGACVAEVFAKESAKVAVVDRNEEVARALCTKLNAEGLETFFVFGDLSKPGACKKVIDEVGNRFGQIDVLVNNAGKKDGVSLDAPLEKFMQSLQDNISHCYDLVHHALPYLKKTKGNVVNISSKVAQTGQGNTSGYAASKGAMNALTREWALDLRNDGIRVNAVVPAEVMTPLYEKWLGTLDNPKETVDKIKKMIPLENRFTEAVEIAKMVVFLASPCSAHTTGQIIYVDGGYTHLDRACTS